MEELPVSKERLKEMKDKLERARDKAVKKAKKKAFTSKLSNLLGNKIEVSPDFFMPTTIYIEEYVGENKKEIYSYYCSPQGMLRFDIKDFLTRDTQKLYLHKSGVIALLKKKQIAELRIPKEIAETITLETLAHYGLKDIDSCLKFQDKPENSSRYFDGDITFKIRKDLGDLIEKISKSELDTSAFILIGLLPQKLGMKIMSTLSPSAYSCYESTNKMMKKGKDIIEKLAEYSNGERSKEFLKRFKEGIDLKEKEVRCKATPKRYFEIYRHLVMPSISVNKEIAGRLYVINKGDHYFEIWIPQKTAAKIKQSKKQTGSKLIDDYLANDILSLEKKERDCGDEKEYIDLYGDFVYRTVLGKKKEFSKIKETANKIGYAFLEKEKSQILPTELIMSALMKKGNETLH